MLRLAPRPTPADPTRFVHPAPSVLNVDGLRLVATHVPGDGLVDVRLLWPIGFVHEIPTGVGELVARSLGTCTASRDAYEFACAVETLGASVASEVTAESTVLRVDAVHDRVLPALDVGLDGLVAPDLAGVERLRVEAVDARRRSLADPRTRGRETLFASIHAGTPYERSRSASTAALQAVTPADLEEHVARLRSVAPTVLVTGNLRRVDLNQIAAAVVGRLSLAGGAAEGHEATVPSTAGQIPRRVVVHRPGAVQSLVHLGHVAPARAHGDHASLLLGVSALGGGFTSRLNLRLREDLGVTYGARAHVVARRATGAIQIEAAVERDATRGAIDETLAVVTQQLTEGITSRELHDIRTWLVRRAPQGYQTVRQTADAVASALGLGLAPHQLGQLDDQIAAVSRDDVVEALRAHLRPDDLSLVVVGDADRVVDDLAQQHGPVTVIDEPAS